MLKNPLGIRSPEADARKSKDFNLAGLFTCTSSNRIAGISGFHAFYLAARGFFSKLLNPGPPLEGGLEKLIVLLPENPNLLLLSEDLRSEAGWSFQPVRFWNPGRRHAHHRRPLPEMETEIKLPARVKQGRCWPQAVTPPERIRCSVIDYTCSHTNRLQSETSQSAQRSYRGSRKLSASRNCFPRCNACLAEARTFQGHDSTHGQH